MRLFNLKFNKQKRRYLRKNMTRAEVILWQELRRKQLGFKFRRQYGIGPYIVDFYCPKLKLVIELDGDVHAFYTVKKKDKIKQDFLKNYNITVIRYWNHEIINEIQAVAEDIYNTCHSLTTPDPSLKRMGETSAYGTPPNIRGRLKRGLLLKL